MRTLIIFIIVYLCSMPSCLADQLPVNWPWRGVTIVSNKVEVDQLEIYYERLKFNNIRIQLRPKLYSSQQNISIKVAWQKTQEWLDEILDFAKDKRISVIINMSHFPVFLDVDYNNKSTKFWRSEDAIEDMMSSIRKIVEYSVSRGDEIVAYDFLSEPLEIAFGIKKRPGNWLAILPQIISLIRQYDKDRWIIVSPGPGGMPAGYRYFTKLPDKKIVYGVHYYLPHAYTHQRIKNRDQTIKYPGFINGQMWNRTTLAESMRPVLEFRDQYSVPIFVGEFSVVRWAQGANQYLGDLVQVFDENNLAWSYFGLSVWHGWNPDFNSDYSDTSRQERKFTSPETSDTETSRWKILMQIFDKQ